MFSLNICYHGKRAVFRGETRFSPRREGNGVKKNKNTINTSNTTPPLQLHENRSVPIYVDNRKVVNVNINSTLAYRWESG